MFAPGLKLPAGSCGGRLLIEENSWRTLTASNESMTAEFRVVQSARPAPGDEGTALVRGVQELHLGNPENEWMTLDYQAELREYPLVRNLLSAVFNQDWREDYDRVEEVYEDILDDEPLVARLARAEQIEAFVATRSEDEVDDVIRASQTGIRPHSDLGVSGREWLLTVARRLRG